ncbi:MAG TPA: HAD family phosphatase [Acidimicrobiia bacterium]|nr:HAD family phosphatase [Acidimicrobiia bacterium]
MTLVAVIFDCDGVLVDSEWASAEAWKAALAGYGYELSAEEFVSFIGTTDHELAAAFASRLDTTQDEVLAAAATEMRMVLAAGLEPFGDALRMVERLQGYPLAVASNSERWRLDCVLNSAGLGDLFAVSVASDEVANPKPSPDVYLRTAALLGVVADGCLVFEDSPTGIAAARAAGMTVVAVDRGNFQLQLLAPADGVVSSLDEFRLPVG